MKRPQSKIEKNLEDVLEIVVAIKDAVVTKDDLVDLENKLTTKIDALENKLGARIDSVENTLTSKIDALDNRMIIEFQSLQTDLDDISETPSYLPLCRGGGANRPLASTEERAGRGLVPTKLTHFVIQSF